jgi:ubiquinone/menaquinone biosynthesis C-methylase UbiE
MIKSQGWDWKIVKNDFDNIWRTPSIESYYLVNRWKDKKDFLDLGCGRGRHSILFGKNGFNVHAFDISEEAIKSTKEWAESENLTFDYKVGDMLELPYDDNSMDSILCRNVISHTDTEGIKKVVSELKRVLRMNGECYLTLASKSTWGYKQDWPMVDENTKLCMREGPEYKVPHFYADYDLIKELFKDFEIVLLNHIGEYIEKEDGVREMYHYHLLIKKV